MAAVVEAVGDGSRVAVDANGRFDLDTALAYGEMLEPFGLLWYEEAGDPLDYALNAELTRAYSGSLATGENLFSVQDSRNLIRHGGMRPDRELGCKRTRPLSYGPTEFIRMVIDAEGAGWSRDRFVPHGGGTSSTWRSPQDWDSAAPSAIPVSSSQSADSSTARRSKAAGFRCLTLQASE